MFSTLNAKPDTITFAYQNSHNYPFQTGTGANINWGKPGLLLEMLKIVEKEIDIKIKFVRFPWKRALFELKSGKVDGLFEASYKKKRLDFGKYPLKNGKIDTNRRTNYNSYFLYTLSGSDVQWDGINIKNLKKGICAEREYSIVDDLRRSGIAVHEQNNTKKCLELLNNNRIDAVAALEMATDKILEQEQSKFKNLKKLQPALKNKVYHLMLSHQFTKKYPELSEYIWDTLEKVRNSNEMMDIRKKY